jgi:hypothetical protein
MRTFSACLSVSCLSKFTRRIRRLLNAGSRGGSLVAAAEITPDTKVSHEVYAGGITGLPKGYTSFVNRWVGSGDPAKGVYTSINVLPDKPPRRPAPAMVSGASWQSRRAGLWQISRWQSAQSSESDARYSCAKYSGSAPQ